MEIINRTYYDIDDLRALLNSAVTDSRAQKVWVQYLSSPAEYSEARYYSHHFSRQQKGWGEILSPGDKPKASMSRRRGGTYGEYVLFIVRRAELLGDNDIQRMASVNLNDIPEGAVKHVAFAVCVALSGASRWDEFWGKCPKRIRIGDKVDKSASRTAKLTVAKERLANAEKKVSYFIYHKDREVEALRLAEEELAAANLLVEKRKAELAKLEGKK